MRCDDCKKKLSGKTWITIDIQQCGDPFQFIACMALCRTCYEKHQELVKLAQKVGPPK